MTIVSVRQLFQMDGFSSTYHRTFFVSVESNRWRISRSRMAVAPPGLNRMVLVASAKSKRLLIMTGGNKLILTLPAFTLIVLIPLSIQARTPSSARVEFQTSGSPAAQAGFFSGLAALHSF